MNTRFQLDLLHPGRVARTWREWFVGPTGGRRLGLYALAGALVVALILIVAILPAFWRLSADLAALPGLRRDLAAREQELGLLRSNLRSLTDEARRQVRWSPLLTALSEQIPGAFRLQLVQTANAAPPPGQPQGSPAKGERVLHIDAVTPARSGSPPLLEAAQFMAGLMRDPAVSTRFQLQSWEIKPGGPQADGAQLLTISMILAERAR